jgi:Kef-type K+ transport system membrane component KefB
MQNFQLLRALRMLRAPSTSKRALACAAALTMLTVLTALSVTLPSCQLAPPLATVGNVKQEYYPLINSNAWTVAASYVTGATITLEAQYISYGTIREVNLLQVASRRPAGSTAAVLDTVVVRRVPYMPSFSRFKQCDTTVFTYTVPDAATFSRAALTNARLVVQVLNQNDLFVNRATNTFLVR